MITAKEAVALSNTLREATLSDVLDIAWFRVEAAAQKGLWSIHVPSSVPSASGLVPYVLLSIPRAVRDQATEALKAQGFTVSLPTTGRGFRVHWGPS